MKGKGSKMDQNIKNENKENKKSSKLKEGLSMFAAVAILILVLIGMSLVCGYSLENTLIWLLVLGICAVIGFIISVFKS